MTGAGTPHTRVWGYTFPLAQGFRVSLRLADYKSHLPIPLVRNYNRTQAFCLTALAKTKLLRTRPCDRSSLLLLLAVRL